MLIAYEFDEFDGHPVITTINQELEQSRSQRKKVIRSSPAKLTDNIDDGCCDTGILIRVHEALLDLGPCCTKSLRVYQRKAI